MTRNIRPANPFVTIRIEQQRVRRPIASRARGLARILFAITVVLALNTTASAATGNGCGKNINACGCSVTTTGVYTVSQNLSVAPRVSDCISIGANNVVLNLNGFSITGPGAGSTGSGVHIKKASSVFIEGHGLASQGATISGWKYGIENDGEVVVIENLTTTGNSKAGIYFFKAATSRVVNFTSSNNGGYGVWLSSGNNNQVGGSDPITDLGGSITSSNALDGVFVGCVGSGAKCASTGGNARNDVVYNLTSQNNGGGGITVQFNSDFNQIGKCTASGNAAGDLNDNHSGASNCAHDLWFANTSGTLNKACIH